MERRTRRLHHQAIDDRDADRAEPCLVSNAEANVKRPIPNHGTERSKRDLGCVRYPIIARQLADARAVDCRDRRKDMQVDRAPEAV